MATQPEIAHPRPAAYGTDQFSEDQPDSAFTEEALGDQRLGMMADEIVTHEPLGQRTPPSTTAQKRPFSLAVERPQREFPATVSLSDTYQAVPDDAVGGEAIFHPRIPNDVAPLQTAGISALNMDASKRYPEAPARHHPQQQFQQSQSMNQQAHNAEQQQQQQQQAKYKNVPKAELHVVYGKPPRRKIMSADNYHTWHDSGQAHMLKWTSVFVCPITGELFPSGKYAGSTASVNPPPPCLWFVKKTQAEHGAAARAYDCLAYRDHAKATASASANGLLSVPVLIGLEEPYLENRAVFTLPEGVPPEVRQNILAQQGEIRRANGLGSVGMNFMP